MENLAVYKHLSWLVGGEAGYGITTMGQMFARACSRAGLNVFGYAEYPSLIRGGHNTAMITVGSDKVHAHSNKIDILLALNEDTLNKHLGSMSEGGVVIYDDESLNWDETSNLGLTWVSIPLARITKELEAQKIMRNTVALGASFAVMGMDFSFVSNVLETTFARKGQEVVDFNVKVAKAGYDHVNSNDLAANFKKAIPLPESAKKQIVVSGNDAIALGAIKAGLKFMSAYPMTPATSIMQTVAKHGVKYEIIMKHTEDEIAAMNMAIGASHMGVRSMTATAGGGFSLMVEALGMAGITETPLVVAMGTRPGPSTGLPTWTDQGDLRFVMHASQGEFPRIVFLPGDVQESFDMTLRAFNLSDKYQMISIVLTDKYLGESVQSVEPFAATDYVPDRGLLMSTSDAAAIEDGSYKRFEFTENGVSRRAVPGMPNCIYVASTDEHREDGDLDEGSENRIKMVDKRAQKIVSLLNESLKPDEMIEIHGPADANLTIVSWGSTKGPILEALDAANTEGLSVNFLQIKFALPFPSDAVSEVLNAAKKTLLIETNSEAQMGGVIREKTGVKIENTFLRYDGRPFHPAQILDKIKESL
ncbi:2-oxoacid:acceptor oxidoreductase subunit alpha [Candidatus Peregrinibacteria bacterium]|jgi:2-oxoglutarate/2-oxoacid ferredoxin oxidoreductase subunit alpha|nr:2-oxoacid:acceptor oxidoreductase subunit alpha [Candidatus Peregrinibacteria bacterium]MBT5516371.1 2-oxoacid:acceptor oxidoreductase subunit alpha [Candidatus Peregrinibacteria bacterium]MBT5824272.1 2-oxoacid:acceptor oxidoreductase subunit alpha [Candidatus Peregrinibacteria bacterium]